VNDSLLQLGLVAVLVALNAGFAGSEIALISLREGQLQRLEQQHETGRVLAHLARDPNQFLSTIQVGITLAGFLASAIAAVSLAEPLVEPLGFLGAAAEASAIVLVTLVLTFVTLVFGELAPKRVAMQRAERWALMAVRPLNAIARLARPVIWLLGASTDLVVRVMGGDPSRRREDVTEEELRDLVASQTAFSPEQRTIISGAFEIGHRTLREILVPRRDVKVLDADQPATEGVDRLITLGHSRAPVVHGDLDDVVGVVHLRDLVGADGTTGDRAHAAMALPESIGVIDALRTMQTQRQQLAIVVNEYGGGEGIVTVEDLIEEVVGEIYDETDRDILAVVRQPDGTLVLPGRFPVHDLTDLGVEVPEGDYATVAGLLLTHLGHIPEQPGETVHVGRWRLEVAEIQDRAITRVRLRPADSTPPGTIIRHQPLT
jgi:magnesium and cobalt exporter, CNNM family